MESQRPGKPEKYGGLILILIIQSKASFLSLD